MFVTIYEGNETSGNNRKHFWLLCSTSAPSWGTHRNPNTCLYHTDDVWLWTCLCCILMLVIVQILSPPASALEAATSQPPPPHNPSSCLLLKLQLSPPLPPPSTLSPLSRGPLPWKLIGRLQHIGTPSVPGDNSPEHSTKPKTASGGQVLVASGKQ